MLTLDDKSGYDHISLHPDYRKYFGIQFFFGGGGGVWCIIRYPLVFKASAYVYHTTGMVPISYCRSLGIPSLFYIDDRLVCGIKDKKENKGSLDCYCNAIKSIYVMCRVLASLEYLLNLLKCSLKRVKFVKFWGCYWILKNWRL